MPFTELDLHRAAPVPTGCGLLYVRETVTMKTLRYKPLLVAVARRARWLSQSTAALRRRPACPRGTTARPSSPSSTLSTKVTTAGSPDFVPVPERIAMFDNDGTLWSEQPVPVQFYFVVDRVKALAPQHPEWKTKEPFASLLKGDVKAALAGGDHGLMELFMATHTGMTTTEFEQIVKDWIATAKHPTDRQALPRHDLSADARSARLPARERLQELHRLRRRHRVHAPVDGSRPTASRRNRSSAAA